MGGGGSKPKNMKDLVKETHLSEKQIKHWYDDFRQAYPGGKVTKQQFQELYQDQFPHGDSSEFADNVFRSFDKDGDDLLDFREFMVGLSITTTASKKEQLTWAFQVYDIDRSGLISMDECVTVIKGVLRMYAPGEGLDERASDLAKKIFEKADKNKDGNLSMQEFVDIGETDKTLMSLIGGQPLL